VRAGGIADRPDAANAGAADHAPAATLGDARQARAPAGQPEPVLDDHKLAGASSKPTKLT
jgi:hypothetical protein